MPTELLNITWSVGARWNSGVANYTFRLEVLLQNQSTQDNTSTITVNKYMKGEKGNNWYGVACTDTFSGDISDSISYNPARQGTAPNYYGEMKNTEVLYHTQRFTINHDNDGSKLLKFTTTFTNGGSSYAPNTNDYNVIVNLPVIARASDISLDKTRLSIGGTSSAIKLTYTITSKADFYHTLNYTMMDNSGETISSGTIPIIDHIDTTTVSYDIMGTEILSYIPTANTGTLVLSLNTYSDSNKTTLVGTKTASCSIIVTIKPSLQLSTPTVATSPIANYAIAGYSTLRANVNTTMSSGATSLTTYVSTSYGEMDNGVITGLYGTATTKTLPAKEDGADTFTVTFTAYTKDSRGNQSDQKTRNITVYKYIKPTPSLTAYRVATNGSRTQDGSGAYLYVKAEYTLNSSINGQNSIQSVVCKVGSTEITLDSNGEYWASLPIDSSTKVTLTVSDNVTTSAVPPKIISTAKVPVHMYDNGAGTVGVGLGGKATAGSTRCYLPLYVGDGGVEGTIRLYSDDANGGYVYLKAVSGLTGAKTIRLPNKSGTVALTSDIDGGGGTTDYDALSNRPKINSVTLTGNKSASDLGLQEALGIISTTEIDTIMSS